MKRDIVLVPDARLKTPCEVVSEFGDELQNVARDLEETRRASLGCVGIAAPQIGEMVRLALLDTSGHKKWGAQSQGFFALVNPVLLSRNGEKIGREGCLSLPDFTANVARATQIRVRFQDLNGQDCEAEFENFEAVVVQHELDHLDGILFLDRVSNLQTDVFARKTK